MVTSEQCWYRFSGMHGGEPWSPDQPSYFVGVPSRIVEVADESLVEFAEHERLKSFFKEIMPSDKAFTGLSDGRSRLKNSVTDTCGVEYIIEYIGLGPKP